jgi:hypothetical protein
MVLALAGCASSSPAPDPTPTASRAARVDGLGAPGCAPASPIGTPKSSVEVQGTGQGDISLYALVMSTAPLPLHASKDSVKLVVRMTGSGELAVTVRGPDGTAHPLVFGPEMHADSSYDRPGREWGLGTVLNQPGCWTLHFRRTGSGAGDVYLSVLA